MAAGDPEVRAMAAGAVASRRWPLPRLPWWSRPSGGLARLRLWLGASLAAEWERGRCFLWLPVCVGIGIVGYFTLPREPMAPALAALVAGTVALTVLMRRR